MDPVVLFFVFGLVAGLLKSELKLPAALYETLSIILLLAIGLHGGVELAEQASVQLLGQAGLVLLLGIGLPLLAFVLLRGLRFDRVNAAAVAAHYGSVSAGTFAVVVAFLVSRQIVGTKLAGEIRAALEGYGLPIFKAFTSQRVVYANSAAQGSTVLDAEPQGAAAEEIRTLVEEIRAWR